MGPALIASIGLDAPDVVEPVDAVGSWLAAHPGLLVIDNLEQLYGSGDVIVQLLADAPGLRVVATSRVALGVRGEMEFVLGPLETPTEDDPSAVESNPAAALFLLRSRSIGRLRDLDDLTARDVAALVRRLDGLPLALELAAARTRALSVREISDRLDRHGLAGIEIAADDRHSLRAILDWTIELLDPDVRELLSRLAVCTGFDMTMAEALAPEMDVVAGLETLIALGLVERSDSTGGQSRFRILETVRTEVDRRSAAETRRAYRERHANVLLARAEASHAESDRWGAWRELDLDDHRIALGTFASTDAQAALRLFWLLGPVWATRGRRREGLDWFERLDRLGAQPSVDLARGLAEAGTLIANLRGHAASIEINRRAMEVAEQVGDPIAIVSALTWLAWSALYEKDPDLIADLDRRLGKIDVTDDPRTAMKLAEARAFVSIARDGVASEAAATSFQEQLDACLALGETGKAAAVAFNLAMTSIFVGATRRAIEAGDLSVDLARQLDLVQLPSYLAISAIAHAGGRDAEAAERRILEAAELVVARSDPTAPPDFDVISLVLIGAQAVATAHSQPLLAAEIAGCVQHLSDTGKVELDDGDRALLQRGMANARRSAREIDIELAIREGAKHDPAALLRSLPGRLATSIRTMRSRVVLPHGELTKREIEVLALVGQGRSDPEIAEALFISPKTASVHVANIKAKLGLQTRLDVALRARELGLGGDEPSA
jgi:predicted ATPase/DNA-binding CsgD family transcriptional regulator